MSPEPKLNLQEEPTAINTTPEFIDDLKEKQKSGKTLSLDEMIAWNAAKLNTWAFCTKHKKKYKFHDGCGSCNDMCNYCGSIISDADTARHHETCTGMPKNVKKQISKKMLHSIELGKELDRVGALPPTQANIDKAKSLRRQIIK